MEKLKTQQFADALAMFAEDRLTLFVCEREGVPAATTYEVALVSEPSRFHLYLPPALRALKHNWRSFFLGRRRHLRCCSRWLVAALQPPIWTTIDDRQEVTGTQYSSPARVPVGPRSSASTIACSCACRGAGTDLAPARSDEIRPAIALDSPGQAHMMSRPGRSRRRGTPPKDRARGARLAICSRT